MATIPATNCLLRSIKVHGRKQAPFYPVHSRQRERWTDGAPRRRLPRRIYLLSLDDSPNEPRSGQNRSNRPGPFCSLLVESVLGVSQRTRVFAHSPVHHFFFFTRTQVTPKLYRRSGHCTTSCVETRVLRLVIVNKRCTVSRIPAVTIELLPRWQNNS